MTHRPSFVDRQGELEVLERLHRSRHAEMVVIYGRRRVGKSALLLEFCRDKPHAYYMASQVRERDSLDQFREVLRRSLPDPLLENVQFPSWDAALERVARQVGGRRFILAIDEFPYLCLESPGLPSILQRWWDLTARRTQILLILCGSHVGFMEGQVLGERSPLFGRRTAQVRLGPMRAWEAARFFPGWSARDRLTAVGVLGGIPAYLERVEPSEGLRRCLLREAFDPRGFLFDEVSFLLRMELSHTATYMSVLKAIARGATRVSEIAGKAGLAVTSLVRYLHTLGDLGLVRRDVPFTEASPEKSKRGIYAVDDPFVSFWCRFVLQNQPMIQAGHGEAVWREVVEPDLDGHMGGIFESMCRSAVAHGQVPLIGGAPRRVGRLWGGGLEIDLLAELPGGSLLVGECKWTRRPVGPEALARLERSAGCIPPSLASTVKLALFSSAGFTPALRTEARRRGVLLADAADIIG